MIPRLAAFLALLLVVGCDSDEPDDEFPDAVLVATVRDAGGAPAVGLDVFLTYGDLVPGDAARHAVAIGPIQAFPTPATSLSLVRFEVDGPAPVTVRLFDVAGAALATLVDGQTLDGQSQIGVDLSPYAAGAYRIDVTSRGETASRTLLKTDSFNEGDIGLAIFLGTTDAQGRLVVEDRTRFPSLYDVPSPYAVTDEQGNTLGQFDLGRSVGLVAQDDEGRTDGTRVTLRDGRTETSFTFAP